VGFPREEMIKHWIALMCHGRFLAKNTLVFPRGIEKDDHWIHSSLLHFP
jgi:hypothetical protein